MKAAATAMAVAPAISHAQARLKLTLATVLPDASFHTMNCRRFAAEVKKATEGAVDIDVQAGGHLGFTGAESLRAVRDGLVAMAEYQDVQQVGDEPFLGIAGLPFLAASFDELRVLQKHVRPGYERVASENNQTILYVVPWPNQYLHLKVKAESADALKGIKIRAADRSAHDLLAQIGMAPVVIPWTETRQVLGSGGLSGVATSAVSGVDGKLWEFVKFFHATNHQWSTEIVAINNDALKKVGAAHRKLITDIARKLEPEFWASAAEQDQASALKLAANGMERVHIPAAMLADLRRRTAPLLDAFMQRVPSSREPLAAYLAEMKRA